MAAVAVCGGVAVAEQRCAVSLSSHWAALPETAMLCAHSTVYVAVAALVVRAWVSDEAVAKSLSASGAS